ncbi:uncharacterized protein BO66DRAFT_31697 [Aspergillus aculeatinus CBS 121060]|uniref:Uncharacterized protein n=1 Tax=Aspergillus aculeatinus CBS 121060 TaxID=1448322 RepID=A0ACD1HFP2_9EURO|nr:hypothetical protein BO66DRAFT_31697 [Aspergillus aculeatinus CBS 121060]RAH72319.1 hypothetical protein BO66DRAFT_31697 [Aspergillus aculeatinus CBS 121060]
MHSCKGFHPASETFLSLIGPGLLFACPVSAVAVIGPVKSSTAAPVGSLGNLSSRTRFNLRSFSLSTTTVFPAP